MKTKITSFFLLLLVMLTGAGCPPSNDNDSGPTTTITAQTDYTPKEYKKGDTFTVSAGDTVKNKSGDANITTLSDAETGKTTINVHGGTVTVTTN